MPDTAPGSSYAYSLSSARQREEGIIIPEEGIIIPISHMWKPQLREASHLAKATQLANGTARI